MLSTPHASSRYYSVCAQAITYIQFIKKFDYKKTSWRTALRIHSSNISLDPWFNIFFNHVSTWESNETNGFLPRKDHIYIQNYKYNFTGFICFLYTPEIPYTDFRLRNSSYASEGALAKLDVKTVWSWCINEWINRKEEEAQKYS